MSADIRELTTKGTITMFDRYRRIQRELQDGQREGDEDGFTLIELLIVIVVLGILAAVTVFGLSNVSSQSLTSACHADAKSVAVAAEAYHAQNANAYPTLIQRDLVTITNGNRYLRSVPGNELKYWIVLDPAGTGKVFVQSARTGDVATPGVPPAPPTWGPNAPRADFEDPTTWATNTPANADPCSGL